MHITPQYFSAYFPRTRINFFVSVTKIGMLTLIKYYYLIYRPSYSNFVNRANYNPYWKTFFPTPGFDLGSPVALGRHAFVSHLIWSSSSALVFHEFDSFEKKGWLFQWMFFGLGLSDVSSRLDSGYWFLAGLSQKWHRVLGAWSQEGMLPLCLLLGILTWIAVKVESSTVGTVFHLY